MYGFWRFNFSESAFEGLIVQLNDRLVSLRTDEGIRLLLRTSKIMNKTQLSNLFFKSQLFFREIRKMYGFWRFNFSESAFERLIVELIHSCL